LNIKILYGLFLGLSQVLSQIITDKYRKNRKIKVVMCKKKEKKRLKPLFLCLGKDGDDARIVSTKSRLLRHGDTLRADAVCRVKAN